MNVLIHISFKIILSSLLFSFLITSSYYARLPNTILPVFGQNEFEEQTTTDGFEEQTTTDGFEEQTTTDGFEEQPTTDGFEEQPTTDGFEEQPTTDGFEEQPTTDGFEEQPTTDGFEEQPTTDGFEEQPTTDGFEEQPTTDGFEEQPTTDGFEEQTTTDGFEEQPTTDGFEEQPTTDPYLNPNQDPNQQLPPLPQDPNCPPGTSCDPYQQLPPLPQDPNCPPGTSCDPYQQLPPLPQHSNVLDEWGLDKWLNPGYAACRIAIMGACGSLVTAGVGAAAPACIATGPAAPATCTGVVLTGSMIYNFCSDSLGTICEDALPPAEREHYTAAEALCQGGVAAACEKAADILCKGSELCGTPLSEICSNVASDWLCEFDPNQPPPPQDPNCPPGTSCDPNQPPPDQPKIPDIPPENRDIDPCFGKGKGTCFSAPPQQPPQQPLPSDSPPPLNKEAGECTVPLGVGCNIIQKGGNNSPSPTIGGDIGSPSNTDVVNPGGGGIPGGGLPGGSGQGTTSSGQGTTSSGQGTTSSGQGTTSSGQGTTSSGQGTTSSGQGTTSSGQGTTSSGQGTTSSGQGTTSSGQGTGTTVVFPPDVVEGKIPGPNGPDWPGPGPAPGPTGGGGPPPSPNPPVCTPREDPDACHFTN